MGPLRNKSVSVRLEEEAYLRLRRHSLRSGVPTSALMRALVHRWLQQQGDEEGDAMVERGGTEHRRQPGLFSEGGSFEWRRETFPVYFYKQDFDQVVEVYGRSRLYRSKGVRPDCLRRIFEKPARQVTDTYERRDAEEGKRRGHPPKGPSEVDISFPRAH